MMVKIRFTAQGSNSLIGGFTSGDVARVGSDLARHLVEEVRVAEYVDAPSERHQQLEKGEDVRGEDLDAVPEPVAEPVTEAGAAKRGRRNAGT